MVHVAEGHNMGQGEGVGAGARGEEGLGGWIGAGGMGKGEERKGITAFLARDARGTRRHTPSYAYAPGTVSL